VRCCICDGYAACNRKSSRKPSYAPLIKSVDRGLALYVETSPRETRPFLFYLHQTAPQLSGFYDCVFWEHLVPQIAFTDHGVRHALIALASRYETFQNRDWGNVEQAQFTLRQCNLAIAKYLSSNGSSDPQGSRVHYLLSCLIFIYIEVRVFKRVAYTILLTLRR